MGFFDCIYDKEKRVWTSGNVESAYNENDSLGQILFESLKQTPNNLLQVDDLYDISITNSVALKWSIRLALYLEKLNLNHQDIVGISAKNSTYLLPAVLGCFFSGVPFHAVNPNSDKNTFSHCYGITKPKIIFCDGEIYEKIRATTGDYCNIIITISEHINGVTKILDLLEPQPQEHSYQPKQLVEGPSQTVAILCSSGTTGKPKAVSLSTTALLFRSPLLSIDSVVYLASGIDWSTGLWLLIANCHTGFTRIITKRPFEVNHFLEILKKYKVTYTVLSSHFVAILVSHPEVTKEHLKTIKAIQFGGSSLSGATIERFTRLFSDDVTISFGYGTTETGVIACNLEKSHFKSVGKLFPNLKLRIVNDEGKNLGINEVGEVLIYTSVPWRGYYNNTVETAQALDEEGWFHTGDLGYMDENNFLYLVERKKQILKYQGNHFWPNEIEHVIAELSEVIDVCVASVFDEQFGDLAAALVIKPENSSLSAEQVKQHVKQRLVLPHKQLNAGVYFVDQLPYNTNNKCDRSKAKKMLENLVEISTKIRFTGN